MRIILYFVGGLLAIIILVFGLQIAASERVEVVELHTVDDAGEAMTTRLWIIDHEGRQYLRAGPGSGWLLRATANAQLSMTRHGTTGRYTAVPREGLRDIVNETMQAKYTWGDTLISYLVGDRADAIPVELIPSD